MLGIYKILTCIYSQTQLQIYILFICDQVQLVTSHQLNFVIKQYATKEQAAQEENHTFISKTNWIHHCDQNLATFNLDTWRIIWKLHNLLH